jgi:fibro-slime domain-containing protein
MIQVEGKIWKVKVTGHKKIIFNQGNSTGQTSELDIPTDGKNYYKDSQWSTFSGNHVAEIVNSPFPVRKTQKNGIDYYEFDSTDANDNLYFDNLTSGSPVAQYGAGTTYGVKNGYNGGWSFMPFDKYNANYRGLDWSAQYGKDLAFGMKLDVNFTLGQGGKINNVDQTFDFTGDDDLWVYVDGKLILDLGGDHAKTSGSINFASRTVTLTPDPNTTLSTTRNQSFADLVDNTDPTKLHKMTIYYMERGMHESNLKFGFSFAPIEDTYDVEKVADISELNEGLKSKFTDTYNYENAGNNTNNKAYTVYNSSTNEEVASRNTSARSFFINKDQYASFKKIFQAHQVLSTTEQPSVYYQYDTTYKVVDMINDDYVIKAGSGRETGNFVFFNTSEDAIEGLSTTHIRTIFTNKLQTQSFMVTKEIDDYDDSSTEFPVIITIKMSPGGSVSDIPFDTEGLVYKSSADNYATERTLGAGGKTTIKEGEHLLFEGIPAGAKVTVYEPTSNNTKYTPAITGNGNCYKYVGIENTASDNQPQRTKDTNNVYTDITIQLEHFDTITIHNKPKTYLVKYTVPTRLYGNKIYKLSGMITPAMVAQGYIDITATDDPDRHTAFINETFMTVHCPFESIFMKDVTWDPKNIVYTDANPAGYDDYVHWAASDPTAKTLTVQVDTDGDGSYETTVRGLKCGGEIKLPNGDYITGTKDGDTPSYWNIISADTNKFVTRSYSTDLMYVAYDNYLITAVYGQGKGSELYNQNTNAVVNDLGITRSHWNDTVSGEDDSNTYKDIEGQKEVTKEYNYYHANTEYDRLYLDIELAFEATGKMINTYSEDEVKVGYDVCVLNEDGSFGRVHTTVYLKNESVDNKNRIHAYYGFKNSESNRDKKLGIRAFIINGSGSSKVYSAIMPFELNTVGSMVG